MAVCCEICGKDTWSADLPEEEVFKKHRWHNPVCPLYGRQDVYDEWRSEKEAQTTPIRGKIYISLLKIDGSRVHTLWIETEKGTRYRLIPIVESGLDDIDPVLLEGKEVDVVGHVVNDETVYYSLIMSRFI